MRHFFDFFFVAIGGSNAATIAYEMKMSETAPSSRVLQAAKTQESKMKLMSGMEHLLNGYR